MSNANNKFKIIISAAILNYAGISIFKNQLYLDCFPICSYLIFLVGVCFLLWTIPFNPYSSCFRKMPIYASTLIEFIIADLLMEVIMNDFWLPLESKFIAFIPTIPDLVSQAMDMVGLNMPDIIEYLQFLKSDSTLIFASYGLSTFFLLCILHATRVVDFRLLQCGVNVFVNDIQKRFIKFVKNFNKSSQPRRCDTPFRCPKPCAELEWDSSSANTESYYESY